MTDATADAAPDDALLIAFANGDGAAGRVLISRLAPRLLAFATRMLGDRAEAEDVVQDTMVRLWKMAPDWRQGEAKVSTWAFRVASNLATDRLRKRGRMTAMEDAGEPADDAPSALETMTAAERANALDAALLTLPDRQREAVVLRHIEGLANPEIADVMDISVEAVESLTARGKRSLHQRLAHKQEALGL